MNSWELEPEGISHAPILGEQERATVCGLSPDQFGALFRRRGHTAGRNPNITCERCLEVLEERYGPRLQQVCANAGIPYERGVLHRIAGAHRHSTLCGLDLNDLDTQMMFNILEHTTAYSAQTCSKCDRVVTLASARSSLKVLAE